MTDTPERISISPTCRQKRDDDYYLVDRDAFPGKGTEYIRADLAKRQLEAADRLAQACSDFFNAAVEHLEFFDHLGDALAAYEATKGGDA